MTEPVSESLPTHTLRDRRLTLALIARDNVAWTAQFAFSSAYQDKAAQTTCRDAAAERLLRMNARVLVVDEDGPELRTRFHPKLVDAVVEAILAERGGLDATESADWNPWPLDRAEQHLLVRAALERKNARWGAWFHFPGCTGDVDYATRLVRRDAAVRRLRLMGVEVDVEEHSAEPLTRFHPQIVGAVVDVVFAEHGHLGRTQRGNWGLSELLLRAMGRVGQSSPRQ